MIRAVICDDESGALKIIAYSIANMGLPIEIAGTARNGKEALDVIRRVQPDLVFLDIEMPEFNGFEVIEQLNRKEIKVIIITAFATFDYAQKAIRLGVNDIIAKPIDMESLRQAVQRVIGWKLTENATLNRALLYLHLHYREKIDLETLAQEACCTSGHLAHLFRNVLNTSALSYLHKIRIGAAVERLQNGEDIKEVAYDLGYSSMNNFYKYFKQYTGQTPASIKKAKA